MDSNKTLNYELLELCLDFYEDNCVIDLLDFNTYSRPHSDSNSTQINIIAKNNLIVEYKHKYEMDYNDWVYNSGGIIGMWFGWSALSITDLLIYFNNSFSRLLAQTQNKLSRLFDRILNRLLVIVNYYKLKLLYKFICCNE